eukprot:GHVQ01021287.1.p1 GENE.GHVQ01021287.1~~GHVQ01021287.1.p1  ORF type:complete len:420 (+),score=59.33 GHVQ01021287.1:189-1262(+)
MASVGSKGNDGSSMMNGMIVRPTDSRRGTGSETYGVLLDTEQGLGEERTGWEEGRCRRLFRRGRGWCQERCGGVRYVCGRWCGVMKDGWGNVGHVSWVFWCLVSLFIVFSIFGFFFSNQVIVVLVVLTGWLISLAIHEFGHACSAHYGGDHSIESQGYLTLNLFRYTSPLMSLAVPVLILCIGGIALPGGAVYIQPQNLASNGWRSFVSLAGPLGNLLCAVCFAITFHSLSFLNPFLSDTVAFNVRATVHPAYAVLCWLQCMAIFLNMIPLPPFDGWGVLEPWLSSECFLKRLLQNRWNKRTCTIASMLFVYLAIGRIPGFFYAIELFTTCLGVGAFPQQMGKSLFFGFFSSISLLP